MERGAFIINCGVPSGQVTGRRVATRSASTRSASTRSVATCSASTRSASTRSVATCSAVTRSAATRSASCSTDTEETVILQEEHDGKSMAETRAEVTLLAMNLGGRFAGREIRRFGEAVLGTVLTKKDADLFFGQQANFRPRLPAHYVMVGGNKAFLAYNKARLRACDVRHFLNKLRDLQFAGKLPFHYLPLSNFTITKFKARLQPSLQFIGVSWLSDETQGRTRNISLFRKLMAFVENLTALEELPVVVAGTFNITLEEASECLPAGFCVYGYIPDTVRRQVRAADFFVCPRTVRLDKVGPVLCSRLHMEERADGWLNPEDAFYCDPVRATLVSRRQELAGPLQVTRVEPEERGTDYYYHRDAPDGKSSPGAREGRREGDTGVRPLAPGDAPPPPPASGLLRKLPSCPELYDDTAAENGTTCYMS